MLDSVVELNNAMRMLETAEQLVADLVVFSDEAEWLRCATVTRVVNMLRNHAPIDAVRAELMRVNGFTDGYLENW